MRRILSLCASSLLAAGMLMAQTSSAPSAPPAQDNNNASQATDSAPKPRDPGAGQNAKTARGNNAASTIDQNTKKPDGTAGATGTSNSDADLSKDKAGNPNNDAVRPESADASNQNTTNAPKPSRAGVPWLWIVIGAIALIALLSLLGGRSPERERIDRVTTIDRDRRIDDRIHDRIDRRDDDIRRVG